MYCKELALVRIGNRTDKLAPDCFGHVGAKVLKIGHAIWCKKRFYARQPGGEFGPQPHIGITTNQIERLTFGVLLVRPSAFD
ncbi:hypothetical protein CCGE525_37425 (plasmid) [Rhizobium jaguaris]|uniref:Uncharacterized protein n=1 Tax=Rhizobium jaguaris TaxID=1312183 RepID=A0A387G1J4_9HYPH|nr:hypothetical protein CCGE525_37425 [Rhizobium jaguaris]